MGIELTELLKLANRTAQSSKGFYDAALKGVSYPATSENIENLNYLQCAWAYESVFSQSSDFTFANRVFKENPQYVETPKVQIKAFGEA
jgi:hypothetical protein